jgi:hypothetical protein
MVNRMIFMMSQEGVLVGVVLPLDGGMSTSFVVGDSFLSEA